jgi:hypothetical protein
MMRVYIACMGRSRAYPVCDLSAATEGIKHVVDAVGSGVHDRDSIAQALGYSSGTGLAARKVSALVQFGFLARSGASYETTELASQLLFPTSEEESAQALRTALQQPTLFRELLDKFTPQGRVPAQLANILVRDHGITREASDDAATVFMRSLQYAGIVDGEGRFRRSPPGPSREENGLSHEAAQVDEPVVASASHPLRAVVASPAPASSPSGLPFVDEQQVSRIALSTGVAELRVPRVLSQKDLLKLKKWLELVSLDDEEET